jgi:hypothetical protein
MFEVQIGAFFRAEYYCGLYAPSGRW